MFLSVFENWSQSKGNYNFLLIWFAMIFIGRREIMPNVGLIYSSLLTPSEWIANHRILQPRISSKSFLFYLLSVISKWRHSYSGLHSRSLSVLLQRSLQYCVVNGWNTYRNMSNTEERGSERVRIIAVISFNSKSEVNIGPLYVASRNSSPNDGPAPRLPPRASTISCSTQ